jgi:hypothetical protein
MFVDQSGTKFTANSRYGPKTERNTSGAKLAPELFQRLGSRKEKAKVHFISDLNVAVFVTLGAPDVNESRRGA